MEDIPPTADALLQHTMQGEQPIRLVYGLQVKLHNKEGLYKNPGAGLGMNPQEMGASLDDTCTANSKEVGLLNITLSSQWIAHYHSFI